MNNKENNHEIEVEAVTIEEAIRKALKMLKANKDQVTITVLKEECKGLFGMEGADLAKIKVTLKPQKHSK
jgi:spoIIIJ-associated protein